MNVNLETVSLYGKPGIGKISFLKQLAEEMGKEVFLYNLVEMQTCDLKDDLFSPEINLSDDLKASLLDENKMVIFDEIDRANLDYVEYIKKEVENAKAVIFFCASSGFPPSSSLNVITGKTHIGILLHNSF